MRAADNRYQPAEVPEFATPREVPHLLHGNATQFLSFAPALRDCPTIEGALHRANRADFTRALPQSAFLLQPRIERERFSE